VKRRCSETATTASTLFPVLWCALGFIECANSWQVFFQFFWTRIAWDRTDFYPLENDKDSGANGNSAVTILRKLSEGARVLAPVFEVAPD
jgi:hypothetical protein